LLLFGILVDVVDADTIHSISSEANLTAQLSESIAAISLSQRHEERGIVKTVESGFKDSSTKRPLNEEQSRKCSETVVNFVVIVAGFVSVVASASAVVSAAASDDDDDDDDVVRSDRGTEH
jgi:hypothetical protein